MKRALPFLLVCWICLQVGAIAYRTVEAERKLLQAEILGTLQQQLIREQDKTITILTAAAGQLQEEIEQCRAKDKTFANATRNHL